MLKYKIDVRQALKEKGYNSTVILRDGTIGQSAMQKIRKGEVIGINVLNQLCEVLEMQPGDIIEYVEKEYNDYWWMEFGLSSDDLEEVDSAFAEA